VTACIVKYGPRYIAPANVGRARNRRLLTLFGIRFRWVFVLFREPTTETDHNREQRMRSFARRFGRQQIRGEDGSFSRLGRANVKPLPVHAESLRFALPSPSLWLSHVADTRSGGRDVTVRWMRVAGLAYVAYFALALAGGALKNVPLQVVATAVYLLVSVVLYRTFRSADPTVAVTLLPLAFVGCLIQGYGQSQGDAGLLRAALVPFGLFLVVLASLLVRTDGAPLALAVIVGVAGLAWPVVAVPGVPTSYAAVAIGLGLLAEGALMVWLLVAPDLITAH
jgi:hypothetical protein